MKKTFVTLTLAIASLAATAATEKAQQEIADVLVSGDYQKMRNVAYGMETGGFGHDTNLIAACAFRRAILFVNADKIDNTDFNNEAITCRKIHATENQQAWEAAFSLAKSINASKK